jgi:hypothetical protein
MGTNNCSGIHPTKDSIHQNYRKNRSHRRIVDVEPLLERMAKMLHLVRKEAMSVSLVQNHLKTKRTLGIPSVPLLLSRHHTSCSVSASRKRPSCFLCGLAAATVQFTLGSQTPLADKNNCDKEFPGRTNEAICFLPRRSPSNQNLL